MSTQYTVFSRKKKSQLSQIYSYGEFVHGTLLMEASGFGWWDCLKKIFPQQFHFEN